MTAVSCTCTDGMQLRLIISVRVVTSVNTSVHKMASPSICVGCNTANTSLLKMKYVSFCSFYKEQYPNDNASEFIASIISLAAILETEANVTKMF